MSFDDEIRVSELDCSKPIGPFWACSGYTGFKTRQKADTHCSNIFKMLGKGWEGYMWEHFGWHCAWQNGAVVMHYSASTKQYFCLIGFGCSGRGMSHSDPIKAIRKACEYAQQVIETEWKIVELSVANVVLGLDDL